MIQPSQLYINKNKLEAIHKQIEEEGIESLDPVPIKELNHEMVATDGHTRLFALHQLGVEEVEIIWEDEELDWDIYQACVEWCHDNDIWAPQHFENRVVGDREYQRLWLDRCKNLRIEMYGEDTG